MFLLLVTTRGAYLNNPTVVNNPLVLHHTGIKRTIQWHSSSKPVPTWKEVHLKNNVLLRRGEFGPLRGDRLYQVENECDALGVQFSQGLSIRKQLMVSKTMAGFGKLKDEKILKKMVQMFDRQNKSLLEMARELDLPPVSIFRAILSWKVLQLHPELSCGRRKEIVKSIITEGNNSIIADTFLSAWELQQLQTAKNNDVVGHERQCSVDTPVMWEEAVCSFLKKRKINFVTETTLKEAEFKSTPDCLILDDLYINGQLIKWIEVKSFYASGLKENSYFTKKQIKDQMEKYSSNFGSGAFIFKDGFCRSIKKKYPSTLFLDGGPMSLDSDYVNEYL